MTTAYVYISALDDRNTLTNQIAQAAKVYLQTISGATDLQKEIRIKSYILAKLFGHTYPFVEGNISVVNWIDANFKSFKHQAYSMTLCTSLA